MLHEIIADNDRLLVPHVIKGVVQLDAAVEHRSRTSGSTVMTPSIDLDSLIWQRSQPGPAFDTQLAEIVDFLVEVGKALDFDRNIHLQEAAAYNLRCNSLGARILENCYRDIAWFFTRDSVEAEAEQSLGSLDLLDGWARRDIQGTAFDIRAFPPRMVHILAGNAPIVPPVTIVRGAISKGVHLLKMPSNDMFTATALLRTMADVGPNHPVTRSFSAAYWRGGDASIENHILRSQYFDKLAVWGGEAAVRHAMQYAAPGFEIMSFDPKVSISLIGREAFDGVPLSTVAERSAADIIAFNQDACSCARFQFIEGSDDQVDRYCEALVEAMGQDIRYGAGSDGPLPPAMLIEELNMLGNLEPIYRLFGRPDGRGMVIRSSEPVSFNPGGKLVNVVTVDRLADAIQHVTVATQSVGVYPPSRIAEVRDGLASAGAQRIVGLGNINTGKFGGLPHDGGWPVHKMMHWVVTEAAKD
ncbi:long-chain-fatty-acyl-CoA reductase [Sphingobium sp. 10 DY56-G10]|uniref:acyl-CoA reductase n=1 Tax=Sphingomonadales TaxID=204457 RepID=UPI0000D7A581|nr:acyl-CoA reductase [Sphingomonas sp. SKA58]EAT10533.1 Fatty acid reductase [Sphingomonas sp. SKA58]|tara:strand:- start:1425 stop:2837 length:1413 start_codon:yes stop_codon:yes gene_type:complete